ncbi:LOW QUALITY PROTEIN: hypothetical protein V1477_006261 [Vespula maculifrons]|uniref:Uncharacterized protein n=1 Tax=Vespula maculifrons TaxID=7453 RepID=A0ABD2CJY1_VESMC
MFPLNRYNLVPMCPIWTKKYERRGRDEPFPTTPARFSRVLQFRGKKLKMFFSFVLFKPLKLGYSWSDLDEKNIGVEGATSHFQIPWSGSRTCYSFGEKNC